MTLGPGDPTGRGQGNENAGPGGGGGKLWEAMAWVRCRREVAKEKWTLDWCVEAPADPAGLRGQGHGSPKTRSASWYLLGVVGCLITRPHGAQGPTKSQAQGDGGAYPGPQPSLLGPCPPRGLQGNSRAALGRDFWLLVEPPAASPAQPCPCGSLSEQALISA